MCRSIKFFPKYVCFPELWVNLDDLDREANHSPYLAFPSYILPAPKILPKIKKITKNKQKNPSKPSIEKKILLFKLES